MSEKKGATGQSFIRREITTYRIGTLVLSIGNLTNFFYLSPSQTKKYILMQLQGDFNPNVQWHCFLGRPILFGSLDPLFVKEILSNK